MGLFDKSNDSHEHHGGRLKQALQAAKPVLNLSADQEQKIKDIFKDFREERHELKDAGTETMRDDIRAARQDARQKLMAVLNDDQRKIVQEHLRELRDQDS